MSRLATLLTAIVLLLAASTILQAGFYEWTDEDGVQHFATSLDQVPEKYRDQVKAPAPDTTAARPAPAAAAAAAPAMATEPAGPVTEPGRFEVPYEAFEGSARRVIIQVRFNNRVTAPMALDTGSPGMVISFELAERLGLLSRGAGTLVIEAAGIGGSVPAILTVVDSVAVELARARFVPTTVTETMSDAFDGLIGMDFLTGYTISIDSVRHVVVFVENPPAPNSRGGHDERWWRKTFAEFRAARDHWRELSRSLNLRAGSKGQLFVEFQFRESERLLQRLDLYASDNAVPRHWR